MLSLGQADDLAWHVLKLSSQVHAPVVPKRLAHGNTRGAAEAFLDYLAVRAPRSDSTKNRPDTESCHPSSCV